MGESGLITVEGEEGVGAESDRDCHLQDVEGASAELCGVGSGKLACRIPSCRRHGSEIENAASKVGFEVVQWLRDIQPTRLAAKDSRFEGICRLKHNSGFYENRRAY